MDAYLSLMLKESGHLHINCVVGTSIFTGNSSLHGNLRSVSMSTSGRQQAVICLTMKTLKELTNFFYHV